MSVIFDQLRISDDGKKMYINLHVNKANYFDNVYLDSITIMTANSVSRSNPFNPTEEYIYYKVIEGNEKELNIVLPDEDWLFSKSSLSDDLFFVYVKTKTVGLPDQCLPCELDDCYTLGVTFDEALLYQKALGYTKDLLKECDVPMAFTDFILQWNAFKAAIETEQYLVAIKFWELLFKNSNTTYTTKPCGCHG